MSVAITKPNRSVNSIAVKELEAIIGKKLPADYRAFLLEFNGGRPENNVFPVPEDRTSAGVDRFYGLLGKRESGDLLFQRQLLLDRMPKDMLPIGDASCGNCICLSFRSDSFGNVFFWDHELEPLGGTDVSFSNLFRVGNSFHDFFSNLQQFDPSQVQLKPGQVKKVWIDPEFLNEQQQKGNRET